MRASGVSVATLFPLDLQLRSASRSRPHHRADEADFPLAPHASQDILRGGGPPFFLERAKSRVTPDLGALDGNRFKEANQAVELSPFHVHLHSRRSQFVVADARTCTNAMWQTRQAACRIQAQA